MRIPKRWFALRKVCDKKLGARYALTALNCELTGDGNLTVVATDGRRMVIAKGKRDPAEGDGSTEVLLASAKTCYEASRMGGPSEVSVRLAGKHVGEPVGEANPPVHIVFSTLDTKSQIQREIRDPAIEGRFPKWQTIADECEKRRESDQGITVLMDPCLLAEALLAIAEASRLKGCAVKLHVHSSDMPLQITATYGDEEFVGIVMPMVQENSDRALDDAIAAKAKKERK